MQVFMGLLLILISKTAFSATKTHVVNGHQAGLTCTVYLHIPDSPDPLKQLPIIFHQAGSGIYTRATISGNYILEFFWNKQKSAILTIDKPGISADPQDPQKPIVDHLSYDRYVMADLVACAKNAVYWAFAQKMMLVMTFFYMATARDP